MVKKKQSDYVNDWLKENYKSISFRFKPETAALFEKVCEAKGISKRGYIIEKLEEDAKNLNINLG